MSAVARVLVILGLVLAVTHPAAVLAAAAAVIGVALGSLGFAIAITVAEAGCRTEPRCGAVSG